MSPGIDSPFAWRSARTARYWLAAGVRNGEVHVWDVSQPTPTRVAGWHAHQGIVSSVLFSRGAKWLFSASADGYRKVWDTTALPNPVASHFMEHPLDNLALSPDGEVLTCGSRSWLWLLQTASLHHEPQARRVLECWKDNRHLVCFSPTGNLFAASRDRRIVLHHYEDGVARELRMLPREGEDAHQDEMSRLEFNPEGTLLLSAAADRKVHIWEVASGRRLASLRLAGEGNIFPAFSPDGRHLAVTSDYATILYALEGLNGLGYAAQQPYAVRAFAWSPTGDQLAFLADDTPHGTDRRSLARVWDLATGRSQASYRLDGCFDFFHQRPPTLTWHPRGHELAFSGDLDNQLFWWPWQSVAVPNRLARTPLVAARFAPDGHRLWGTRHNPDQSDQLLCWSWPERALVSAWDYEPAGTRRVRDGLHALAVGRTWVVVACADGTTKLFAADNGRTCVKCWPVPEEHAVMSVALSPDERLVVSGSQVGQVQIARLPAGQVVGLLRGRRGDPAHTDSVEAVAFSPDGSLLVTAALDGLLRFWQRAEVEFRELVTLPAPGPIVSAAFNPAGTKLAFLLRNERAVRVLDMHHLRARLAELGLRW